MKIFNHVISVLIMLCISSCSYLSFTDDVNTKKYNAEKYSGDKLLNCPTSSIPKRTKFLINKKKKILQLHSVKIKCKLVKYKASNKILIQQTIYYEILQNKEKIKFSDAKIYIGLINHDDNLIKFKAISKVTMAPLIKLKNKLYFKNTSSFMIDFNKEGKKLVFYYGFEN